MALVGVKVMVNQNLKEGRISSVAIVVYERTHLKKDYWHNKKIEKTKAMSRIFVARISYDRKSCITV